MKKKELLQNITGNATANGTSTTTGIIYIQNTLNNTILTLTDQKGNVKTWSSSGSVGFKSARKATSYAAQSAAEALAKKSMYFGFKSFEVNIKGLGYGKESALRGLQLGGLFITKIQDTTPFAHNGCRPPKQRRI